MTIKKGDVFEHKRGEVKRNFIYCGKLKEDGKIKFLLYQYNDYGATAQYLLVDKDWMQDKKGEIEFLEEFPFSAIRLKETFLKKYKPVTRRAW